MFAKKNPVAAIVLVLGVIAVVFLWLRGFRWLGAKMAGWKEMIEKYPAPEIERPGEIYKEQTGYIGSTKFERTFDIQLIEEGIRVCPDFASRSPILIPWSSVSEISVSDAGVFSSILLTVNSEKSLQFRLPKDALPTIQEKVPTERFHKAASFSDQIKNRLNNRRG